MMVYSKIREHVRPVVIIGLLLALLFFVIQQSQAEDFLDEPVETLETIEVPATAVIREKRHISIPFPAMHDLTPLPMSYQVQFLPIKHVNNQVNLEKVARDPIADFKGTRKPVRPAKAERPPYPEFARKQGWEGTVVLRIRVNKDGSVDSVKLQKKSEFPILDDSALQSVKTWTFEPAKDGEFSIPATVDLPIRFDLDEQ